METTDSAGPGNGFSRPRSQLLKTHLRHLLFVMDIAGTFLFAIEGASTAIRFDMDLLGLMVLAFATALGGGLIRDLLIGAVPPNAIADWRYGATAFLGAGVTFAAYSAVRQIPPNLLVVLDAAGLALFAMSGAGKALSYGIHPFMAVLMGGMTGVGGGTIRDLFTAQIPAVLRTDIYAIAAIAGSLVMIAGIRLGRSPGIMAALGGTVCFGLRVVSVWQHWNLPRVLVR